MQELNEADKLLLIEAAVKRVLHNPKNSKRAKVARGESLTMRSRATKQEAIFMPKIAELKEIDGAMWARLDIEYEPGDGSVSLLTAAELKGIIKAEREQCAILADDHSHVAEAIRDMK